MGHGAPSPVWCAVRPKIENGRRDASVERSATAGGSRGLSLLSPLSLRLLGRISYGLVNSANAIALYSLRRKH